MAMTGIAVTDTICPVRSNKHEGLGHVKCLGIQCSWYYHCFPTYAVSTLGKIVALHCDKATADRFTTSLERKTK